MNSICDGSSRLPRFSMSAAIRGDAPSAPSSATAAWADDQRLAARIEMKRERAIRIAHLVDAVEPAVPRHDARPCVGVDVKPRDELRRDALDGVDARVRVPSGLDDARAWVLVH